MKRILFGAASCLVLFTTTSAYSQCCCSGVNFKVLDKHSKVIPLSKLKITNITTEHDAKSLSLYYDPAVSFHLYCGNGREVLSIIYKGKEMKVRFRFLGDFGHAYGEFKFEKGEYVAEPLAPKGSVEPRISMNVRKMKKGEFGDN